MLCTMCAAPVGCSITHQTIKATASHPRMVFKLTSPPKGARLALLVREPMLTPAVFPAKANAVKLPCRHEYAPCSPQYARSAEAVRDRASQPRRPYPQNPSFAGLIGDFAAATGGHLTAFLRAEHAGEMTVPDAGETDFAVIVYREEDQWEADVLPAAVTADLDGLVQALLRQPSIGGTIGFAGVGDDFFVAVRGIGGGLSVVAFGPPA